MANIVVNKNFNQKYLYRFIQHLFKPSNTGYSPRINNGGTVTTQQWSVYDLPFITKESTINTLEKISRSFNEVSVGEDEWDDLGLVIGGIFSADRDIVLARMVETAVITQAEMDDFLIRPLTDQPVINTMVDENGLMTFSLTNVNRLVTRFDAATENTGSEQIYICFAMGHSHTFNGITNSTFAATDYNYFCTTSEVTKQCFPYVAVSIGTAGTEDVVFDYTDIIDYLDDIDIQVQIPKQLS